jgi:hypothetical protein
MACVTTNAKILIRRDLAANWSNPSNNPVLLDGEMGYEKDTGKMKIGDGIHRWNDLPYFPNIPTTFFDGGFPDTVYTNGPVFDLGGVT